MDDMYSPEPNVKCASEEVAQATQHLEVQPPNYRDSSF